MPGPVVADRDLDPGRPRSRAPPAPPRGWRCVGRQPLGVLEHVGQDLADEHVVDVQQREVGRQRRRVDPVRVPRCRRASRGPPSTSSSKRDGRWAAARARPASMRVMSSRLVTSRARRSACSSISSSSSARSSAPSRASAWRRLDTAVLMEASGVRRSCEAAPISALRQRSISSSSRVRKACSRSCARSTASAAWLANVPSRLRSRSASCTSWSTSMPTGRWLDHERDRDSARLRRRPRARGTWPGRRPTVSDATSVVGRAARLPPRPPAAPRRAGASRPPAGSTSAVQRGAKTPWTRRPRCAASSWERVRSPIRACESS